MKALKCRDCGTTHNGGHVCLTPLPSIHAQTVCPICGDWMEPNHICPTDIAAFEGKKYDGGKPDLSLLPREFVEQVSLAFMYGEKKYGRYNYMGGMDWHRLIAATLRHVFAWAWGEDRDSESGLSHLAHAGATIAMLISYQSNGLGKDTRYKK